MKPGPKPKPTRLRILEGSATEADASREPQPPASAPAMPAWLDADGQAVWSTHAEHLERLGLLTAVDGDAFGAFCQAVVVFRRAAQDVNERGHIVPGSGTRAPQHVKNPSVGIMLSAASTVRAFASEYGLTPASRARMSATEPEVSAVEIDSLFTQPSRRR